MEATLFHSIYKILFIPINLNFYQAKIIPLYCSSYFFRLYFAIFLINILKIYNELSHDSIFRV